MQGGCGGYKDRTSAKPILPAVKREHVDSMFTLNVGEIFGFQPGDKFEGGVTIKR